MSTNTLWLPTVGREIPRPWFVPDRSAWEAQQKILAGSYFLVRIDGNNSPLGERLVCDPKKGGCGGKHSHISLRCISQPFSGLTGGLFAYWRAVGDNRLAGALPPAERARYEAATDLLGGMPDISTAHPQLASSLTRDLAPNDAALGAVALGVLEAIPAAYARKLAERINQRGLRPRFTLPGPAGKGG